MTQSHNTKKNKFVTNIFGDNFLPLINGKKFEEIAYSTFFDINILEQLSQEFTFYIFIGTDSGMLLKHIQLLNIDPESIYLFIEDTPILGLINAKTAHTNVYISSTDKWQKHLQQEIIKYIKIDRVKLIQSFSAQEQTFPAYADMTKQLHRQINQLKWLHPDKFQKKIYIQRQIENCADNLRPAIELKDLLKGKPALILAGGPSLDHYIDWIEEHQQHYIVIAVSRIARRLLSTKIIPDIFVTADPFETAFTTSKEMLAYGKQSILVSQNYAHPQLIGQWQGPHFYLGDLLPWNSTYSPENIKGIGPTVANCAIHLAIQMGMLNQTLLGVDLCYDESGYSHVSSTDEYDHGAVLGFTGISIKRNNNKSAETTYELSEARQSIILLAELVKNKGGEIINPSPESAHIDYVSFQNIENMLIPHKVINDFSYIIQNLKSSDLNSKLNHFSELLSEHKNILQIVKNILKLCNKYIDSNKIEDHLKEYSETIKIIESFGINGYYDFIHPEHYKIIKKENNKKYYNSLYIACDLFIEYLNNSIDRINSRIIEHIKIDNQHKANHKLLIKQWNKDKQFGRIKQIRKNNLPLYKNFSTKNKDNLLKEFDKLFESKKIKHANTKKSHVILLEDLEKKLYYYFQKNEQQNLISIINKISNINNENSIALKHLAQGYLYELGNETELAIEQYIQSNTKQTHESGLKRILDITLKQGDIENTIAALKALSNISPVYLIQLANLYQLSKHYKDALDTYSQYIDINQNDILILIKIGLLYVFLDIIDGAKFIFQHLLEISPNNQTAIKILENIKYSQEKRKHQLSTGETLNKNRIKFKIDNLIEIYEYYFFQRIKKNKFDVTRLNKAKRRNIVGFIVTNEVITDKEFINYIKQLYLNIKNCYFTVFYLNDKLKKDLTYIFKNEKSRIKFIQPKNIYDIVENVEIYIDYSETQQSYFLKDSYINISSLIMNNCRNIFISKYIKKWINETFQETSKRMLEHPIMKSYEKIGFTDHEMKKGNYQLVNILFSKALYSKEKKYNYIYKDNNLTNIESIKLALKHENFIHFMYDFKKKAQKLNN